jgi:hypothetical protein
MLQKMPNILILFLLLAGCQKKAENDPWFAYSFLCQYNIDINKMEDQIIEDVGSYVIMASYLEDFASCSYKVSKKWALKKCLQGQVYREVESDCKGTGNPSNLWGAQVYKYCPENNTSCETENITDYGVTLYYAGPVKSPAAGSCNAETVAGMKWSLAEDWGPVNYPFLINHLNNYTITENTGFWALGNTEAKDQAWAAKAVNNNGKITIKEKEVNKDSDLFVFCYSAI